MPRARPDSALGRALRTAMANAADVTFKEVVREACLSRDHFMAWTDAAGSAEAAARQASAALGVAEHDRIEDIERDIVDGPNLPRAALGGIRARARIGRKDRAGQRRPLAGGTALPPTRRRSTTYLGVFLTETERTPRKTVVTSQFPEAQSRPRPSGSKTKAAASAR